MITAVASLPKQECHTKRHIDYSHLYVTAEGNFERIMVIVCECGCYKKTLWVPIPVPPRKIHSELHGYQY
jgi:hypothetical protein